eukprot:gnl/TRDRNA2_/TRDRNA2_202940_c0_seq1.p1 gnl/TRDRNA2_/TRDRNA2_202940_c0~~gnl/TRDRNA2_/TRDRNA2_202940_c0_seq1.p1  ORF type:complete len:127 (+),score=7.05 gnl/TRDRNA2_/TRDRNA2_202940_c0_seq1:40-420(+)
MVARVPSHVHPVTEPDTSPTSNSCSFPLSKPLGSMGGECVAKCRRHRCLQIDLYWRQVLPYTWTAKYSPDALLPTAMVIHLIDLPDVQVVRSPLAEAAVWIVVKSWVKITAWLTGCKLTKLSLIAS